MIDFIEICSHRGETEYCDKCPHKNKVGFEWKDEASNLNLRGCALRLHKIVKQINKEKKKK